MTKKGVRFYYIFQLQRAFIKFYLYMNKEGRGGYKGINTGVRHSGRSRSFNLSLSTSVLSDAVRLRRRV